MSPHPLPESIRIWRRETIVTVFTQDYIRARTKDLIEFGYRELTEDDLAEQLSLYLAHKDSELTVIGLFLDGEVIRAVKWREKNTE